MKNRFYSFLTNRIYQITLAFLSVLLPSMFCAMRLGWVFIDPMVFDGFCITLIVLMVVNGIFSMSLVLLKDWFNRKEKTELYAKLLIVSFSFTALFIILIIAIILTDTTVIATYTLYFVKELPYTLPIISALICLFVVPKFNKKIRGIISIILIAIIGVTSMIFAFKLTSFKLTAGASVYDLGNEYYAVTFATSHNSVGYLEYETDGATVTVYDEVAGGIRSNSKIHSILIEKTTLQNNTYKIGATRVYEHLGNSASTGKNIESAEIAFEGIPGENMELGVLTDVHNQVASALTALNHCGQDFDGLILLGDMADMYNTEDDFIDNVLYLSAQATNGKIPVFFVRGNHETRSAYASEIYQYIPLENQTYYYSFDFGSVSALVLDVAEDKADDHIEYGGLANYEPYRAEEEEWMQNVQFSDSANIKHKLVICHIDELNDVFGSDWSEILSAKTPDLLICGHSHISEYCDIGEDAQSMYYPVCYMGGKQSDSVKYIASKIVFTDTSIEIITYTKDGDLLLSKMVK